jgi:hypothetical protein
MPVAQTVLAAVGLSADLRACPRFASSFFSSFSKLLAKRINLIQLKRANGVIVHLSSGLGSAEAT